MVLAVSQLNRTDVTGFSVKSEIVVQAPPVIAKTFFNLETRRDLVVVAWHVRHLHSRQEMGFTVGIVGFREHPCELETRLDHHDRFVTLVQFHRRIQVGNCDVIGP